MILFKKDYRDFREADFKFSTSIFREKRKSGYMFEVLDIFFKFSNVLYKKSLNYFISYSVSLIK